MNIQKMFSFLAVLSFLTIAVLAQTETPPTPGAPRSAKIPAIVERKLPNGLTVAAVERKNVPLVTIEILVRSGASKEEISQAGLANLTASMLTKGTKTRTATQIAEQIEFLGGSVNAVAGWNNSVVQITVTSDKLDQAMAILADVVLNPSFKKEELDLLKSQTLDGLVYNLKQPGFLANYVASRYSFGEHPAGGTPESISKITVADVVRFKRENYLPDNSVLIFTGDVAPARANTLAQRFFGAWRKSLGGPELDMPLPPRAVAGTVEKNTSEAIVRRILVVDLPDSGQAAVNYAQSLPGGRIDGFDGKKSLPGKTFFPASVFNSVLGGGYSSRLNQEIRIKRGLSYGAGSSVAWRGDSSNFSTGTQTKNESAAEVVELVLAELEKLKREDVGASELNPRKLVLTGDFGRDLETTAGLAGKVGELYGFFLPASEMNSFVRNVQSISAAQIKSFADTSLKGGDIIIVGDYKVFRDDLAKRFPNMKIEVVKSDELNLTSENLRK
jgi:zinc protease